MTSDVRINDTQAREILARAAEIDRAQSQMTTVDSLRAAAREAGIADSAFDAALAEIQRVEQRDAMQRDTRGHRRSRALKRIAIGLAAVVLFGAYFAARRAAPAPVADEAPVEIEAPAPPPPAVPAPAPAPVTPSPR